MELQNEELRNTRDDSDAWLELYTDLYDFAPVSYFTLDRGGVISQVNLTGAQLLGLERSRLVNASFGLFVSSETLPAFNTFLASVFVSREKQKCEVVVQTQAGATLHVRIDAAPSRDGEECRISVVDITERKHAEEVLKKYQVLSENSRDIMLFIGLDGRIVEANDAAVSAYGYTRDELLTRTIFDLRSPETVGQARAQMAAADLSEIRFETIHQRKDRSTFHVEVSSSGADIGDQRVLMSIIRDVTARKQAEEAVRESEQRFHSLFENMLDGYAYCRGVFEGDRLQDFEYIEVNSAFEQLTGLTNVVGKTVTEVIPGIRESNPGLFDIYGKVALTGQAVRFESFIAPLGIWLSICVYSTIKGLFVAVFENITLRKQAEERAYLARRVLEVLNQSDESKNSIGNILSILRESTGFEAVGIRLEESGDFPYYVSSGFPEDFVCSERFICERDETGQVIRDENGATVLECMCGNVIRGRTDRSKPFFSEGGSFWTNSTTKLLASTSVEDRRGRTRNRCARAGYESVALIPLRSGDEVIGLLQLNDHRPDLFTLEMIRFFEGLGASIGVVLKRKQAEKALRESKELVTRILESISDAFFTLDRDWRFTYVNSEAEHILRMSRDQLIGAGIWDQFPEAIGSMFHTEYERAMRERTAVQFESYYPPFDQWFEVRAYPYEGGLSVYFQDCSERRAAQEILARSSERSAHIADVLQQTLIPPRFPAQPAGYEIAARYQPALTEAEVCGDFYDLIDLDNGKLGVLIGDVVGKGLPAAVRVAAVKHTIRSYAFLDDRPSAVVMLANDALSRETPTDNDALTVFFAVLDTRAGDLTYANAGHEPPLVWHPDGRVEPVATGGAMFMGVRGQIYPQGSLSFQAGDVLVMVTDGITEARPEHSVEFFGTEGILDCLSKNVGATAEQIAASLLQDAVSFANGALRDDAAIVVIRKL